MDAEMLEKHRGPSQYTGLKGFATEGLVPDTTTYLQMMSCEFHESTG